MAYQIDQSGKIEQTNKDTVIAYSNNKQYAIVIRRRLKRKVQEAFRLHGFISLFIYYLFSVGVYYLIEHLVRISDITIDAEYPSKDRIIRSFLHGFLEKNRKPSHNIRFARIGNRPRAHYAAKDVFDKKIKPDRIITIREIIEALKKTDGRLKECLSTLIDVQARSYAKRISKKHGKVK